LDGTRTRSVIAGNYRQIYKKSGMEYFVTQKIYWNDTTKFPYKLFWWEAPDGSRLLTYIPHDSTAED
jgi:alpha-mannosidase